jgi:sarcosine oxidase
MAERADVVVVGAGVMGLATAHALARAGREPVVLEQFELGHTHGSSHGATRIFRLAYEDPEWVRLARKSLRLWRELEADSGETLLELTGLIDLPEEIDPLTATLDATGTRYELLTAEEVEHRFGVVTDCDRAVWQPEAGVVLAGRALQALATNVAVRKQTRVRTLLPGGVETDHGRIEAEMVVVAAGAWARGLLGGAGIDLPVVPTQETVAYFRADRAVPSVIDYRNRETYALAAGDGLVKVGVHRSGPAADPAESSEPDQAIVGFASTWAAKTLGLRDPEPVLVETCLYTNTADARFVLERHGPVVVCSACSGHGFKFAPAVGQLVAQLAT